jgi:YidC/Oxa1 family membrane protein insertase
MDRTSWTALIVCLVLLVAYQPLVKHFYPPAPASAPAAPAKALAWDPGRGEAPELAPRNAGAPTREVLENAPSLVLQNDLMAVHLTGAGAGVERIVLRKHLLEEETPVELNRASEAPLFNLRGWALPADVAAYTLVERGPRRAVWQRPLQDGLRLERIYELGDDYVLTLRQTVYNDTDAARVLPSCRMDAGTIAADYQKTDERRFLGVSWRTTGGGFHKHKIMAFDAGFFGLMPAKHELLSGPGEALEWTALTSQFFCMVTRGEGLAFEGVSAEQVKLPGLRVERNQAIPTGIHAVAQLPGFEVEPRASFTQTLSLYAGPKEYERLKSQPGRLTEVMEFGWMEWISVPMLWVMNTIHDKVGNYGVAILLLTICLRGILWYPQGLANASAKRMQTVAPVISELQKKYKDDPERMNKEMLKIYQDYGVNPLGGCLPMLIQIPIFFGFFYMLQGAVELRHQGFLWVDDLSQPDTVFRIPGLGLPVNLLPLVMTATMYWSMSVAPQPAGVDNPMLKVMKLMPLMFLVFCYSYAAALSLYWTMQNVLSVVQIKYNLQRKPPTLEEMKQEAEARRARTREKRKGFGRSLK